MLKRVLLKLSGEQFAGRNKFGIDTEFVSNLAKELADVVQSTKSQIVVVVGGGNFVRGANVAGNGIERATADYMGMLATVMNGMAFVDILEHFGQPARLQTRVRIDQVAEPYIRRRAIRHLEKGRVVVVAGGTGNPYVTTDTAAIMTALEVDAEMVLKATKVDGVYDKDPMKHVNATKLHEVNYLDALKSSEISVMDNAAISLAMDYKLPITIFDLLTHGNIKRIISGEKIGTIVK